MSDNLRDRNRGPFEQAKRDSAERRRRALGVEPERLDAARDALGAEVGTIERDGDELVVRFRLP